MWTYHFWRAVSYRYLILVAPMNAMLLGYNTDLSLVVIGPPGRIAGGVRARLGMDGVQFFAAPSMVSVVLYYETTYFPGMIVTAHSDVPHAVNSHFATLLIVQTRDMRVHSITLG